VLNGTRCATWLEYGDSIPLLTMLLAPAPEFQLWPAKTFLTLLATVRAPPSSCTVLHLAVACRARHPTPSWLFPFLQLPPLCYRCLLCYIRGLLSLSPSLFLFPLLPLFVWAPCIQRQHMPLVFVFFFCMQSFLCVPVRPPAMVKQRDRVYEPDERSEKRIYKHNGEVRMGILATLLTGFDHERGTGWHVPASICRPRHPPHRHMTGGVRQSVGVGFQAGIACRGLVCFFTLQHGGVGAAPRHKE